MTKNDLLKHSQELVLRIVKMTVSIADDFTKEFITDNILRSAAKVSINLSSNHISETKEEEQERFMLAADAADMTLFWLEFIGEVGLIKPEKLVSLKTDYVELKDLLDSFQTNKAGKGKTKSRKARSTHDS